MFSKLSLVSLKKISSKQQHRSEFFSIHISITACLLANRDCIRYVELWKRLCHWHLFIIILIHLELRWYDAKGVDKYSLLLFSFSVIVLSESSDGLLTS